MASCPRRYNITRGHNSPTRILADVYLSVDDVSFCSLEFVKLCIGVTTAIQASVVVVMVIELPFAQDIKLPNPSSRGTLETLQPGQGHRW